MSSCSLLVSLSAVAHGAGVRPPHEEREARPGLETPEGVNARCQGQATTTSAEFLHDSRLRTKQILKGLRIKDQV